MAVDLQTMLAKIGQMTSPERETTISGIGGRGGGDHYGIVSTGGRCAGKKQQRQKLRKG